MRRKTYTCYNCKIKITQHKITWIDNHTYCNDCEITRSKISRVEGNNKWMSIWDLEARKQVRLKRYE